MTHASDPPAYRIGHGYDLHRLEPIAPAGSGRPFVLAGLSIPHDRGPVGHSDGDVLFHAVTDAVLGALGEPDLGSLFPDTDPALDGADSAIFLDAAAQRMRDRGYVVGNVDATIICERPKISPLRAELAEAIARRLGCEPDRVNVKGKTHEKVDAVGEGRAIEVHVVILLTR